MTATEVDPSTTATEPEVPAAGSAVESAGDVSWPDRAGDGDDDLDDDDLGYGADLIGALIAAFKQFGAVQARISAGGENDMSHIFLLVRLIQDGPRRASDLAETVCADQSTVSRQVAGLVKAGLVERRADPADGRASILVPTQAGIDKVAEHRRRRGRSAAPIVADWSEEDRTSFLRQLRRYTRGLEVHRDAIVAILTEDRTDGSL